jgi:hypothetical protein
VGTGFRLQFADFGTIINVGWGHMQRQKMAQRID